MLEFYNVGFLMCLIKVCLVLVEKEFDVEYCWVDLCKGEQFMLQYLVFNLQVVVLMLVDDGMVVIELMLINEYFDDCFFEMFLWLDLVVGVYWMCQFICEFDVLLYFVCMVVIYVVVMWLMQQCLL